jgi:hypothetical protein
MSQALSSARHFSFRKYSAVLSVKIETMLNGFSKITRGEFD